MADLTTAQTNKAPKTSRVKYYVLCAIGIGLMFLFGLIPPFAPEITPVGMQILGVFLGVVLLWSTVGGITWPSLLAIVALGCTGYTNINAAIGSALGSPVVMQMLAITSLTAAISKSGAGALIARWFISRKALEGKPLLFSFVFLFAFMFVSSFTNGVAMIFLGWTVLSGVTTTLGVTFRDKYFGSMYILVAAACGFGEFIIPLKGWQMGLCLTFESNSGIAINYPTYILIAIVLGTILLVIGTLAIKYVLRADMSKMKSFRYEQIGDRNNIGKFNSMQITYMATLVVCLLLALCANYFPVGTTLGTVFTTLSATGIFMVGVVVLCVAKRKNGENILDFGVIMKEANVWGPVLLVAAAMPIASALTSEATGLMAWVNNNLQPLFAGQPVFYVYAAVTLVALVLTNLGSNTGIGLMMIPLSIPLFTAAGANMTIAATAVIYSASLGLVFPGASAITAMLYGTGEVKTSLIIKLNGIVCIAYAIIGIVVFPLLDAIM